MRKWLIVEAALLTLVPTMILLYALPVLMISLAVAIFGAAEGTYALYEYIPKVIFGALPYAGGFLGLWIIWRYVFLLSKGKGFLFDGWFAAAFIGGCWASWELVVSTTNWVPSAAICAPTWILVAHLLYLRRTLPR